MSVTPVSRRLLLRVAILSAAASPLLARAGSAEPTGADAAAPVQRLNTALLSIMKAGQQVPFHQRYDTLAPVVEQTFDLSAVLQLSVGPRWASLPADEQARLLASF